MNFLIGKYTDKGIKKDINQDSMVIKLAKTPNGRVGLFAVADGMGGLSSGELASSTMIQYLSRWFDEKILSLELGNDRQKIFSSLNELLNDINIKIVNYGMSRNEMLGTTISLMITVDRKFYIAHVGDSRVYKVNPYFQILTEDHTLMAREIKLGNMTREEANRDKRRNILLQCVGGKNGIEVQFIEGDLVENETYILCTDGFYKKLSDEEIEKNININLNTIESSQQLDELAKFLSEKVMERKEVDNISTILIKTIN